MNAFNMINGGGGSGSGLYMWKKFKWNTINKYYTKIKYKIMKVRK